MTLQFGRLCDPDEDRNRRPAKSSVWASTLSPIFQMWDHLHVIKRGMLYQVYENASGKIDLQLIAPKVQCKKILRELHETLDGHLGEEKMLTKLRAQFYWPSYHSDVRNCCHTCPQCVSRKAPSSHSRVPLTSTQAGLPMQMFGVIVDNFDPKTKAFCEIRVHGIPFIEVDLVWLHSPVLKMALTKSSPNCGQDLIA